MPNQFVVRCQSCGSTVVVDKPQINHVLHLFLSVITLGLWLPVWGYVALVNVGSRTFRCPRCGGVAVPSGRDLDKRPPVGFR